MIMLFIPHPSSPLPSVVKEEIAEDEAQLPNTNGRVVCWVSSCSSPHCTPTFVRALAFVRCCFATNSFEHEVEWVDNICGSGLLGVTSNK